MRLFVRALVLGGAKKPRHDLAAVHNLSIANLEYAARNSGLVAPSIAVIRLGQVFTNFGDVSLVAPLSLVDPTATEVYNADIYSPRYPEQRFRVLRTQVDKIGRQFQARAQEFGQSVVMPIEELHSARKEPQQLESFDMVIIAAEYLATQHGIEVKPVMQEPKRSAFDWLRDVPSDHALFSNLRRLHSSTPEERKQLLQDITHSLRDAVNLVEGVNFEDVARRLSMQQGDEEISLSGADRLQRAAQESRNTAPSAQIDEHATTREVFQKLLPYGKDFAAWFYQKFDAARGAAYFTHVTSTGRRVRKQWNEDNVLAAMTGKVRNREGFNYGLGCARAVGAKKFRTLDEMQRSADSIVDRETMDQVKNDLSEREHRLSAKLYKHTQYKDTNGLVLLHDALKLSYRRGTGAQSALRIAGYQNVPAELVSEFESFARELVQSPTEYYEAKPKRVVKLQEFFGLVVPAEAEARLQPLSERFGLELRSYRSGAQRAAAVTALAQASNQRKG